MLLETFGLLKHHCGYIKAQGFLKAFWNVQTLSKLSISAVEKGGHISVREISLTGSKKNKFVNVHLRLDSNKIIILLPVLFEVTF